MHCTKLAGSTPRLGGVRSDYLPFSPPFIGEEEIAEVVATLRTPWITTGPKTAEFEKRFADYVEAPAALAVTSCTDAMHIALAALGVGRGDAVFTTTMTFCATVNVIEHLAATPILVDVEADTLNIDPVALEAAIARVVDEGTLVPKAIMPVHYVGHPADMDAITDIADRHGLAIVEDAAHAVAASYRGRPIGAPGDGRVPRSTAFSFYATKNLCTSEGGMLTGDADFIEEARLWSLHGMSRDAWKRYGKGGSWNYEVIRPGFKANMTDITASLGLHQLDRLEGFQERRHKVAASYNAAFAGIDEIETPTVRDDVVPAWHLYVIRLDLDMLSVDRARFVDDLAAANIGASVHFIPVHSHPWYRETYGFADADFPVAWREFQRILSLPLNPRLTEEDIDDVVSAVADLVATHRR